MDKNVETDPGGTRDDGDRRDRRANRRRRATDPHRDDEDRDGDGRGEEGGDEEGHGEEAPSGKGGIGRPLLIVAGLTVLALAAIAGGVYWLHERHFETTDDAFIDTHIVRLAPQIAGRVTAVQVDDNQAVKAGQVLVTIDSADAKSKVAQIQAQLAQARSQVDTARSQISVAQANFEEAVAQADAARAQADDARRDLQRFLDLQQLNPAAVSRQQLDDARTKSTQADAQRDSALKVVQARDDQVDAARTQQISGEDQLKAVQAELDQANNELSYARLVAPVAGHVAQETVAVGNYVQPGTQLLAIIPFNLWVTANFEETQLADMRVGQKVALTVDACPDVRISGHVNSIQHGAGQAFSILPAENATGNYVKVVQRVPVKIVLDNLPRNCTIGPGMSVEPQVTVR